MADSGHNETAAQPDLALRDAQDEATVEESEEQKQVREDAETEARERLRREREARAQALTLEIIGDLPSAEVKPPENVLFVCKLNPVTEDEDLNLIFSRFGSIISCEVIRDKRTGDSLQYAFIEFENQKDCEQAYFKMQGVLIDDHRIHVDFSQSVSRLSDKWRTVTNGKRKQSGGGFGGVAGLEKKRQYRAAEHKPKQRDGSNGYDLVFDKVERETTRQDRERKPNAASPRKHSRSRSPSRRDRYRELTPPRGDGRRRDRSPGFRPDRYDKERRRR